MTLAVTVTLAVTLVTTGPAGAARVPVAADTAAGTSVDAAYQFLDLMMDKYATGSTVRLVQSFTGGLLGQQDFTDSETYDDALIIDAYLTEGTTDGLARAEVVGKALLYVQAHDPKHDGRMRQAYAPEPLAGKKVKIIGKASDVGNMAWVGQSLVELYAATGTPAYLAGAVSIGDWVQAHAADSRGSGGYTGGDMASGRRITWKSTEHNIDLFVLFTSLAAETGDGSWSTWAASARRFVVSMWDRSAGRFSVGTTTNGVTPNESEQPEDVNSWSYLALHDPTYASSLDWDVTYLAVTAGGFSGVSFCAGDRSGVWFEGTAHLADALELRSGTGDATQAGRYLAEVAAGQSGGPNSDGMGVIAASENDLSDCDGDSYDASLHTGATAWYILAAQRVNPLSLFEAT